MLEKLIDNLELQVAPFAMVEIRSGWNLSLADPGTVVIHFVLSGEGSLQFDGQEVALSRGMLVLIPSTLAHVVATPGATQEVAADARDLPSGTLAPVVLGESEPLLVMTCGRVGATFGGVTALFDRFSEPLFFDFSSSVQLPALFDALVREQANPQPGSEIMAATLMRQCFILMLRKLSEAGDSRLDWIAATQDSQLSKAVTRVLDDPGAPHTVESLANLAGMSRSVFSKRFREAFGRSPMDFVREVRMRHAARLLRRTDLPVESVADRVGLSSRSHFSQLFVNFHGMSPSDFRAAAHG